MVSLQYDNCHPIMPAFLSRITQNKLLLYFFFNPQPVLVLIWPRSNDSIRINILMTEIIMALNMRYVGRFFNCR